MFENIKKFLKKFNKKEEKAVANSKDAAKERLHLVLMQDRANVSADFLELMKQEIIEVIKKYIDVDESAIDVRLTNQENKDGTNGAPALYANIPIVNIKNDTVKIENKQEEIKEEKKAENKISNKETENKNQKEEKEPKKESKTDKEDKQKEQEVEGIIIDNGEKEQEEKNEENTNEELKSED
ncbi:MAG: cell division topological specificity factor MinE [Clostridia bacterium]|nr:cell division topological specificity factor MinE [Clostridia bacterium]